MWVKSLQLTNIKSFADSGAIEFSPSINLLVGPNNAGKSIILRAIALLQPMPNQPDAGTFIALNVRHGCSDCEIRIQLQDPDDRQLKFPKDWATRDWHPRIRFAKTAQQNQFVILAPNNQEQQVREQLCNPKQPNNFLYPYFSRRKPAALHEAINLANAETIEEALQHLPSKVDRLSTSRHGPTFATICERTLGFRVACVPSPGGKQIGLMLEDDTIIPVTAMGEGTINILTFLVHLASSSGKLFIIEEIENDLHPKALKSLLEFIITQSQKNQFIISSHSNIVTRYLGAAADATVFAVDMEFERATNLPTSTCRALSDKPEERIKVLENLGYEPFDFFLWKGYLILEESTAEKLIREFLIPFLVRGLHGKLATIAAGGISDVEPRFNDFMRVFVFIHTAPQYKERGWVAVDGGDEGKPVIERLRAAFKTWPEQHFRQFSKHHFEEYYPASFQARVSEVLTMPHGHEKQRAKGKLVEEVLAWALEDLARAQKEFNLCAKEVLDFLSTIASKLQ